MKTRKYIYTTLATCLFVFSSCLNDLDVLPLDPTVETADKAYTDAESYTKGLHKIYSVWALSGQDGDLPWLQRLSRAPDLCGKRLFTDAFNV